MIDDEPLQRLLHARNMILSPELGLSKERQLEELLKYIETYTKLRRAEIQAQHTRLARVEQRYDRIAEARRPRRTPQPRPRDLAKRRLFQLASPEDMLEPVNVVEIYFRDQPRWASWDEAAWPWEETRDLDERMLPFVQKLDPDEPLPDDARLAQPMTAAGVACWRALHVEPGEHVVVDAYDELAGGIRLIDGLLQGAVRRRRAGDVSDAFVAHFGDVALTAERLLLHAARVGLDAWLANPPLIRRCRLGAGCQLGRPFFVTRPGERNPHNVCNVRHSRQGGL